VIATNALVNKIVQLIGNNNFDVIPLRRGKIQETKLQVKTEKCHAALKFLNVNDKKYYT